MSASFGIEYPLQRDGNSQNQRTIEARDPVYAPADGRKIPDLLHFWAQFSKVVLHWDTTGRVRDWASFFTRSVPFRLAEIYQTDAEQWWEQYQEFRSKTDAGDTDGLALVTGYLFAAFQQHQNWHLTLKDDTSVVGQTVRNLTETNLRFLLAEFVGIFNSLAQRFNVEVQQDIEVFFDGKEVTALWQWDDQNKSKTDTALSAKLGNKNTILPHLLPRLDQMAEVLYKSQLAILAAFPKDDFGLEQLIAPDGEHEPHIGLMLAFLRLFRVVQGDFNQLTERHFTFFYREVLHLTEKEAVPDAAHLSFELAKQVPEKHKIALGTGIKNGKDDNKTDIIFTTTDELVVNLASVADVRTLFFPKPSYESTTDDCPPFVPPATKGNFNVPCVLTNATSDFAPLGTAFGGKEGRMGFVIGSPVLRLSEGKREVTLILTFKDALANPIKVSTPTTLNTLEVPTATIFNNVFKLEITTKDKWLPQAFDTITVSGQQVRLPFIFLPETKPIEPLVDTKLNPYGSEEPLLKVLFDFGDDVRNTHYIDFYNLLKDNQLESVKIEVKVTGVKNNLILKNDEGILDAKKPFEPFGTAAKHRFYASHPDFANKTLTKLEYDILFDAKCQKSNLEKTYNLYSGTAFDRTNTKVSSTEVYNNFSDVKLLRQNFSLFGTNDDNQQTLINISSGNLSLASSGNFVALDIIVDAFLHQQYPLVLSIQGQAAQTFGLPTPIVNQDAWYRWKIQPHTLEKGDALTKIFTSSNYEVPFPSEPPYNPVVQSFSVNFDAEALITQFIQILPFNDSTEIVETGKTVVSTETDLKLVPVFAYEGQLFIGLKNAPQGGNVALLFQVNEYTGNADLTLPDITWFVLQKGNTWKKLQKDIDYSDDTEGLAQPGIIRFELPKEASVEEHTILPSGLTWLRAAVEKNTAAFDRLSGIHAQAVKAIFAPEAGSDLFRLNTALPADSLKKFVVETANINKTNQPYPSFGGKAPESLPDFYRRSSERLRHKSRAINIWDYETIVLEAFPQIYKVKCLNHTLALRGMDYDFEFLNGHVTMVVIPDVKQLKEKERQEPKASQNLLGDIKRFLSERISPFVQLEVLNPRYEKIDACFKVKFLQGKDDGFYTEALKTDLKNFLSPWRMDSKSITTSQEIQFGGEIHRSSLIRFVELRDYVDYVVDFYIGKNVPAPPNPPPTFDPQTTRIEAQTARSVLAAGEMYIYPDLQKIKLTI